MFALHVADKDSIPNIHKVLQAPLGVIPKFRAKPQPCALPTIAPKQIKTNEALLTLAELETAVSPSHKLLFQLIGLRESVMFPYASALASAPVPLSSLNCE